MDRTATLHQASAGGRLPVAALGQLGWLLALEQWVHKADIPPPLAQGSRSVSGLDRALEPKD